jgi:adenylate cyclase
MLATVKVALRVVGAVPLLLAVALGWWAAGVSVALGAVVFVAVLVAFMVVAHNFDGVVSRRFLARDDQVLFRGCEAGVASIRRLYRHLPASPRCRLCLVPFAGVGGWLGIRPSRKNANFCQSCIEAAPLGGHEIRTGVLFADIRGFTPYSEAKGPTAAADLLSRFYALASDVLTEDDALVELVGDQVMALYLPMFPSLAENAPQVMVDAARRLQRSVEGREGLLPVGVGLHIGTCSVGNVRKGGEKDFTAVGDVVNTAARLQGQAAAGEIVVSSEIHAEAGALLRDAKPTSLALRGKEEPFAAYVLAANPSA